MQDIFKNNSSNKRIKQKERKKKRILNEIKVAFYPKFPKHQQLFSKLDQ